MPLIGTFEEHGCTVAVVGMENHTVFVRVSPHLECVGLTVWPADAVVYFNEIGPTCDRYGIELSFGSSRLLTAVALRDLPLGEVQSVAIQAVKTVVSERTKRSADKLQEWAQTQRANARRKNQKDPLWYALLARDYVDFCEFSNPSERLAKRHDIAQGSMGAEIKRARSLGLLTGTVRGRSGGQLTPKAWALLATQEKRQAA
jgi:hypothetical protein